MALPEVAPRPATPRWVGIYVIWWGGDDWEFSQCVRCNKPLRSTKARKAGYGPECAQHIALDQVATVLRQERLNCRSAMARGDSTLRPWNRATRADARPGTKAPTAKQLKYLRRLAEDTGYTYKAPLTRRQASVRIQELEAIGARRKKPKK